MKNTKIMAVLVVLLAAMLFVGAASAAGQPQGTYFVNQELNLSDMGLPGNDTVTLYKLSGDATPVVIDQVTISNNSRILPSAIGENTGVWYINNASNVEDYISIWYPTISIGAELAPNGITAGDSINGKTINTDTEIAFIIDAPRLGVENISAVKIVFTTPAGGKTTVFGTEDFNSIQLNQTQVTSKNVTAGDNAEAGTWTAQAEFVTPTSFANYADKSNTISFTLQSTSLTIAAAKDSVIRSNPFVVNIQGNSQTKYAVYLDGADGSDVNPFIAAGQSGFVDYVSKIGTYEVEGYQTAAVFNTDASGNRVIQYNTNATTEDKTYTIKVIEIDQSYDGGDNVTTPNGADYDTVKVKVEKGAVTISASGDGQYYIGQEITLSGTNTDSDNVYLFITGPNLDNNGIVLKDLPAQTSAYLATNPVSVKTDDTWEYKWDTSGCALDTGAYTIYATSVLTNGKSSSSTEVNGKTAVKLSDSEYATVSVNLKQPFLSAVPSGTIVAKGDKIYIRGTAEGDPSTLMLYIFGPNKFVRESITVEDDGSYEKKLDIGSDWASNQYYVVIEHPMYNGIIDVKFDGTNLYIENSVSNEGYQASFPVAGNNRLQSSNAADALTKMIDSANIDDVYTKLTFTVDEPRITITNPGDQAVGSTFTISGTTNLAVDDQILVEVASSSFNAVDKTSTSITDGVSQTTKVVAGEGTDNVWSVEVDTTNWKLDEYTIKVSGIEVDVTATTNFNLVEQTVTPTATATATTTATATATATANSLHSQDLVQ